MNSKHEPKIVKTTEEKLETRTFFHTSTKQNNKTPQTSSFSAKLRGPAEENSSFLTTVDDVESVVPTNEMACFRYFAKCCSIKKNLRSGVVLERD